MAGHWAIDFGMSNTVVCTDIDGTLQTVELTDLVRPEPLTQTPLIPTAVCVLDHHFKRALIGQKAIAYNWDGQASGFIVRFKRYLGTESQRPMAKIDGKTVTARDAAFLFFRELLKALETEYDEALDDLIVAVPCGGYETYRAELYGIFRGLRRQTWWQRLLKWLSRRRPEMKVRTVDEPVAAALGYGVRLQGDVTLVIFDFGAGTLGVAAVRLEGGRVTETGRAEVLAKQSLQIGGDDVDGWVVERFVPEPLRDLTTYRILLKWEGERVKISASRGQEATFTFRDHAFGTLDYHGLADLLAKRGLYREIQDLLGRLMSDLKSRHGLDIKDIDEVLMEGGSTLLPGIRDLVADFFGREKVREWLPFESVARGACLFASGASVDDIIYHDYALQVVDEKADHVGYELLIPRGTRYPTPRDFVTRYYAPAHDGQTAIHLFVCEVGGVAGRPVQWESRPDGTKYFVPKTEGERAFCVCLNANDEAIPLDPPGRKDLPRIRVTFSIDADRWLRITVHDLVKKQDLRVNEPVVRLR